MAGTSPFLNKLGMRRLVGSADSSAAESTSTTDALLELFDNLDFGGIDLLQAVLEAFPLICCVMRDNLVVF